MPDTTQDTVDTVEIETTPTEPSAQDPNPAPAAPAKEPTEKFIDISTPIAPKAFPAPPTEEPEDTEKDPDKPKAEGDPDPADTLANQSYMDILEGIGEPTETPPPAPEEDEPAKPDPAAPPAAPAAATEPPAKPATPPAEKKTVKFELPEEFTEPARQAPASTATPPTAPSKPAAPPADPDADYIATLPDEVQAELADAAVAERVMGDKYSGHKKKLIGWLKGMDAEIEKLRKENPDRSFGTDDTEYQTRLAELKGKKPVINRSDEREIIKRLVQNEVKAEVLQEIAPQISEVARQNKAIELRPKVAATAKNFGEHIKKLVTEHSDVMKPIMEDVTKLGDKAAEQYALELDIIDERTKAAQELMSEYLMVKNGATRIDPNNLTPAQSELNSFIVEQGNNFVKTGGKKLVDAQGRRFLPNHQMNDLRSQVASGAIGQEELDKHWTFNDEMILGMLALKAKIEIESSVSYEMERAKKYNFERKPKVAAPPAPPATPPTPTPKSKPRPSIGGGQRPDKPVKGYEQIDGMASDLGVD